MFKVRDFMTKDVVCTEPDTKISAVLDLMKQDHIHRIPVVDKDGRLIGLITEGMIAADSSATSLSIFELNYLLSKTEVKTVMKKKVQSISEDAFMEQATEKMLDKDIGCLPVVNSDGKVVGILTQNDVFKSFLEVLGWKKEGARISLQVPDQIGQMERISKMMADEGINMYNVGVYENKNGLASMILRVDHVTDGLKKKLEEAGFARVDVEAV